MDKDCYVKIKGDLVEAEFLGVFQFSNVIPPSLVQGGDSGGIIAYPIALVKLDEKIQEVKVSNVIFKQ